MILIYCLSKTQEMTQRSFSYGSNELYVLIDQPIAWSSYKFALCFMNVIFWLMRLLREAAMSLRYCNSVPELFENYNIDETDSLGQTISTKICGDGILQLNKPSSKSKMGKINFWEPTPVVVFNLLIDRLSYRHTYKRSLLIYLKLNMSSECNPLTLKSCHVLDNRAYSFCWSSIR